MVVNFVPICVISEKMELNSTFKSSSTAPKVPFVFYAIGLLGLGALLSMFDITNNVSGGYVATGIILLIAFKWEKIEN